MNDHTVEFRLITDPGHGWLEVDWTALKRLDMGPRDFSRYSYRNGNTFYLEEDRDAGRFINAYQAKYHHSPRLREVHMEVCFIRNLPHITD